VTYTIGVVNNVYMEDLVYRPILGQKMATCLVTSVKVRHLQVNS